MSKVTAWVILIVMAIVCIGVIGYMAMTGEWHYLVKAIPGAMVVTIMRLKRSKK